MCLSRTTVIQMNVNLRISRNGRGRSVWGLEKGSERKGIKIEGIRCRGWKLGEILFSLSKLLFVI